MSLWKPLGASCASGWNTVDAAGVAVGMACAVGAAAVAAGSAAVVACSALVCSARALAQSSIGSTGLS